MKLVDLTHRFEGDMSLFPGMTNPTVEKVYNIKEHGCNVTKLDILSHMGTHLDCSSHVLSDGFFTDTKDINFFTGKAKVIDCSHVKQGEEISVDDVIRENIDDYDFILFYTGWDKHWKTDLYGDEFPVVSRELAEYLKNTEIKGIGLDVMSLDKIKQEDLLNHKIFLSHDKIIVENLTNLDKLLHKDFNFMALPLKIKEGDGSPVRAVAIVE